MNNSTEPYRQRGFTLVELMIVLIIAGTLATLAVPSYREFVANQRIKNASFDLVSTLSFARSEAIKRNVNVTVNATGGAWANGWSVVESAGSTTLSQRNAFSGLSFTGNVATVTYSPAGRLTNATQPSFEISVTGVDIATPRCIAVDLSGRPNSRLRTGSTC